MKKSTTLIVAIILVVIALPAVLVWRAGNNTTNSTSQNKEEAVKLDIDLKDGKPTAGVASYIVQPGVRLEFHITTDKLGGEVSVPTEPAQTIKISGSPLIFSFNASEKAGNYALAYRANSSSEAILIGNISVRKTANN